MDVPLVLGNQDAVHPVQQFLRPIRHVGNPPDPGGVFRLAAVLSPDRHHAGSGKPPLFRRLGLQVANDVGVGLFNPSRS